MEESLLNIHQWVEENLPINNNLNDNKNITLPFKIKHSPIALKFRPSQASCSITEYLHHL